MLAAAACLQTPSSLHHYRPDELANAADDQAELSEDFGGGRSLRPVAGGSRTQSIDNTGYNENRPYHNFGCANQRNLAAMIDNPADLEQPRPETPAYTMRRNAAFEKYRKGELDHDHLSGSRQGQTQRYR